MINNNLKPYYQYYKRDTAIILLLLIILIPPLFNIKFNKNECGGTINQDVVAGEYIFIETTNGCSVRIINSEVLKMKDNGLNKEQIENYYSIYLDKNLPSMYTRTYVLSIDNIGNIKNLCTTNTENPKDIEDLQKN